MVSLSLDQKNALFHFSNTYRKKCLNRATAAAKKSELPFASTAYTLAILHTSSSELTLPEFFYLLLYLNVLRSRQLIKSILSGQQFVITLDLENMYIYA